MARATRLPRGISVQSGRYRVRVSWQGKQYSVGMYGTLGDAKAALAIAQSDVARGVFVPPSARRAAAAAVVEREARESVTVKAWSTRWLEQLEANPKRSKATVISYESVLRNHLLPELGELRLVDLTPELVQEHLVALRSKKSKRHPDARNNGIASNAATVLRSMLNAAIKQEVGGLSAFAFPETPAPVRVRPIEEGVEDVATPAEVMAFTKAMPEHLRIAVPLAAWCALRIGEVLGLERRDLEHVDDPHRAILRVRRQWNTKANTLTPPKANSTRSPAIPAFMLDDLSAHLDRWTGSDPDAPVLTSRGGGRVSQTQLDNAWRSARDAAGRPGFRFHDLRHTGLTLYAQQGATLAELLERGGHSDVSVALRYQHATAERDRALTERLADVVRHAETGAT